jgi:hypothetical protein
MACQPKLTGALASVSEGWRATHNQVEVTAGSTEPMDAEFFPQARWSGKMEEVATALDTSEEPA